MNHDVIVSSASYPDPLDFSGPAEATHRYDTAGSDWGFSNFISVSELRQPNNRYLFNDTLTVAVSIRQRQRTDVT